MTDRSGSKRSRAEFATFGSRCRKPRAEVDPQSVRNADRDRSDPSRFQPWKMPPGFLTIRTVLHWLPRRQCLGCLVVALASATWSSAQTVDPLAGLQAASDAAEAALRDGERQIADSRYREALREGWLVIGGLDGAERQWADAATAFEHAASATVHPREGLMSLALVHMQTGRAPEAVQILTRLVARDKSDIASRRLLAQALAASGQQAEAVQELEEAAATAPGDDELKFVLASGYLQMKKLEAADRLFGELARNRPIPQTHVLIGRTYRDSGEYIALVRRCGRRWRWTRAQRVRIITSAPPPCFRTGCFEWKRRSTSSGRSCDLRPPTRSPTCGWA